MKIKLLIVLLLSMLLLLSCDVNDPESVKGGTIIVNNKLVGGMGYKVDIYIDDTYQGAISYDKQKTFSISDDEWHNLAVKASSGQGAVWGQGLDFKVPGGSVLSVSVYWSEGIVEDP